MPRLTKKQHEQDSMILGAIIAGSYEKPLREGHSKAETNYSLCAVGAGIIRTRTKAKIPTSIIGSIERFASIYKVSIAYACGVNDGFEQDVDARESAFSKINRKSVDYKRGWNVGEAANIQSKE